MKKLILISSVFLAYVVLFTLFVMIYFYGLPGKDQYIGTSINSGEDGADLRKISIATCSGEGDLFLYEGDPFQDIDTIFESSGDQVLVFSRKELDNVTFEVNGNKVNLKKINDSAYTFDAAYGSKISVEGEMENGARGIQGYLTQEKDNPVYETDTFQFLYDDQTSNEMFLIPGHYSYAFFDKYSINAPGTGSDNRFLKVKVTGGDGTIVDRTYTHPNPDGVEGAVVDGFKIEKQGNYTLSVETDDSVYWALVECPICGDGKKEKNEQCDDGQDNGRKCEPEYGENCSYCSNSCEIISIDGPFCGDSTVNGQEQCDEGSKNGEVCFPQYDGKCTYCSVNCRNTVVGGSFCGDGKIDEGEECDSGVDNGIGCKPENGEECTYCSQQCKKVTNIGIFCGDGEKNQDSEECDDGNNISGDGCSSKCKIEQEEEDKDCGGSIGNYVWYDENGDGVQDANEEGLGDIRLKLEWAGPDDDFGDSDDEEFRTETDHKGRYVFEDLCEGKYKVIVKEEDVVLYTQTYDPDGDLDNETKVTLKGDYDEHTKADFGYRKIRTAPAAGLNFPALLMISATLTAITLLVYELVQKRRQMRRKRR